MDGQNTDAGAGPTCAYEMTVSADMASMPGLVGFLEGALEVAGCPPAISTKLMICLDEIASNVMKFSKAGELTVRLGHCAASGTWLLSFADDGTPWNPLTHDDPDITLPAAERPIGGLGLLMVKRMMDDVTYAREGGKNVLCLKISVRPEK
ncbi:MAG: ATP-binding protein [Kiritimatiellae bacterium]|nr:ATP-binding protein [Kiritimatiellia bacterium]